MVATFIQSLSRFGKACGLTLLLGLALVLAGCASLETPITPDPERQRHERLLDQDFTRDAPRVDAVAVVDDLQHQALEHQANGQPDAAVALLERALRIDNRDADLYRQIADVRLSQGRFAQAEQVALRGLSEGIEDPGQAATLWRIVAQARSGQGDPEGAQRAREQACAAEGC